MKRTVVKLVVLSLLLLVASCACAKKAVKKEDVVEAGQTISECPEDGTCTLKIFKNKRLVVLYDDIGKMFYKLEEDSNTSVVIYEYNRKTDPALQDGQYREEVVFEVENKDQELKLKDMELIQAKMLFGRHCFCRGQTGYYYIQNGELNLVIKDAEVTVDLKFKITEVPQTISAINAVKKTEKLLIN